MYQHTLYIYCPIYPICPMVVTSAELQKYLDDPNYIVEYEDDGSVKKITHKPIEYIQKQGPETQLHHGGKNVTSTYIPAQYTFDSDGRLTDEVQRSIYTTMDVPKDSSREVHRSIYTAKQTQYNAGVPTLEKSYTPVQLNYSQVIKPAGYRTFTGGVETVAVQQIRDNTGKTTEVQKTTPAGTSTVYANDLKDNPIHKTAAVKTIPTITYEGKTYTVLKEGWKPTALKEAEKKAQIIKDNPNTYVLSEKARAKFNVVDSGFLGGGFSASDGKTITKVTPKGETTKIIKEDIKNDLVRSQLLNPIPYKPKKTKLTFKDRLKKATTKENINEIPQKPQNLSTFGKIKYELYDKTANIQKRDYEKNAGPLLQKAQTFLTEKKASIEQKGFINRSKRIGLGVLSKGTSYINTIMKYPKTSLIAVNVFGKLPPVASKSLMAIDVGVSTAVAPKGQKVETALTGTAFYGLTMSAVKLIQYGKAKTFKIKEDIKAGSSIKLNKGKTQTITKTQTDGEIKFNKALVSKQYGTKAPNVFRSTIKGNSKLLGKLSGTAAGTDKISTGLIKSKKYDIFFKADPKTTTVKYFKKGTTNIVKEVKFQTQQPIKPPQTITKNTKSIQSTGDVKIRDQTIYSSGKTQTEGFKGLAKVKENININQVSKTKQIDTASLYLKRTDIYPSGQYLEIKKPNIIYSKAPKYKSNIFKKGITEISPNNFAETQTIIKNPTLTRVVKSGTSAKLGYTYESKFKPISAAAKNLKFRQFLASQKGSLYLTSQQKATVPTKIITPQNTEVSPFIGSKSILAISQNAPTTYPVFLSIPQTTTKTQINQNQIQPPKNYFSYSQIKNIEATQPTFKINTLSFSKGAQTLKTPRSTLKLETPQTLKTNLIPTIKAKIKSKAKTLTATKSKIKTLTRTQTEKPQTLFKPIYTNFTPTPLGFSNPKIWLPKRSNTNKRRRKNVKSTQPKKLTPTGRAAAFSIKGSTTAAGIKTGLGERYIILPKRKKTKWGFNL